MTGAEPQPEDEDLGLADVAPTAAAEPLSASRHGLDSGDDSVFVDDVTGGAGPTPPTPKPAAAPPPPRPSEKPAEKKGALGLSDRRTSSGRLKALPPEERPSSGSDRLRAQEPGESTSSRLRAPDPGASTSSRLRAAEAGLSTGTRGRSPELQKSGSGAVPALTASAGHDDLSPGAKLGGWKVVQLVARRGRVLELQVTRADGTDSAILRYHPLDTLGQHALDVLARAERSATVRHDWLEAILDQGRGQGGTFFVVPESRNLDERLSGKGRLSEEDALATVRTAARALATLHARNLVHGDPSPRNVLDTEAGTKLGTPARAVPPAGLEGLGLGADPRYAAPEVLDGQAPSASSDVFSLGLVLAFLLTGQHPVSEEEPALAVAARARTALPVLPSSSTSAATELVYQRATAEVGRRYNSADELARDLDAIVEGRGASIPPLPPRPARQGVDVRPPLPLSITIFVAAIVALVLGTIFVLSVLVSDPVAEHAFQLPHGAPR